MSATGAGNWFEDRFLGAEGTAIDPVLRPYSGPEEPLVGATKGASQHNTCCHTFQTLTVAMSGIGVEVRQKSQGALDISSADLQDGSVTLLMW